MLYRFMKSAGAVAIGLAVLLGWSAHAVDLDKSTETEDDDALVTFAAETIPAVGADKLHVLPGVDAANVTFKMPKATNGSHLRIELTGGAFRTAFTASDVADGSGCGGDKSVAFGGEVTSKYVIVECGSTANVATTLNIGDQLSLTSGSKSISVTISQWFDFERALLSDKTIPQFHFGEVTGQFVAVSSLASATVKMPMTTTASVAEDFKMFKTGGGGKGGMLAQLAGSVKTMINGTATNQLISALSYGDPSQNAGSGIDPATAGNAALAFSSTTVTLTEANEEDLSFGNFFLVSDDASTTEVDERATCVPATGTPRIDFATKDSKGPYATGTVVAMVAASALLDASICVELKKTGDPADYTPVPTSSFTATVAFAAPTAAPTGTPTPKLAGYKPADAMGAAGTLKRDGTVVHIPFLTTAEGYNHRVVILNRNKMAVKYSVAFTDEANGTSTPGDMASGMLMANSTTTLRTGDLVSVEGRSRTGATVTIVSTPQKVDVQTTLRNNGTGTYDTVIYDAVEN